MKKKSKQYKKDNTEAERERNKQYRNDNAEMIKEQRNAKKSTKLCKNPNCGKLFKSNRNQIFCCKECKDIFRRIVEPLRCFISSVRSTISHSIKNGGYKKTSHTYQLLGCSYIDFLTHLGPKPSATCQLDHICPCTQATNKTELIALQHHSNFQWLEAHLNIVKSDSRTPEGEVLCLKLLGRPWLSKG
jgi:hypothetical protein